MEILVNILAFFLPVVIFCFWGIVGYATMSLLRSSQRNILQNILLAPTVGFAVTAILIFWLNHFGLPVKSFATILTLTLLMLSIIILWQRKPLFPIKKYLLFIIIFSLSLCITGSPLLKFGFDWVSFSNDDMANYCLAASRFLNHGFLDLPNTHDLINSKDYSLFYWFLHVPGQVRSGSDLTLAWVSGVTHLTTFEIFMPVILAFHLLLISAAGALALVSPSKRPIALITCLLLTFSALTTLGTLYQLIAQVSGLSLLTTAVALMLHRFSHKKKYYTITQGVLIAIILSCLLITYPEVLPFLAISFILYFSINFLKGWRFNRSFYITLTCAFLFTVLTINVYLTALSFLYTQSAAGIHTNIMRGILFPYYLIPSGFADFWGLKPIGGYLDEPQMSIRIALGILLSLVTLAAIVRLAWKNIAPSAVVSLVMFCLGIFLFIHFSDFGLFKLSMYIQPFVIVTIAISLFQFIKRIEIRSILIITLIVCNLKGLDYYIKRSEGVTPGGLNEVLYASSTKIHKEFLQLIAHLPDDVIIMSNTFNVAIFKMQTFYSIKKKFYNQTYHHKVPTLLMGMGNTSPEWLRKIKILDKNFFYSKENCLYNEYFTKQFRSERFFLHDTAIPYADFYESLSFPEIADFPDKVVFITDSAIRGVINRRHIISENKNFTLNWLRNVHNYISFVDSSAGHIYFLGGSNRISFFNVEGDFFYPNKFFQALGRFFVFKIFNPTPTFRVVMSLTNTLDGNSENTLPPAKVTGDVQTNLPLMGRGSARVFSAPISAQIINNNPYFAIDMGIEGKKFPSKKTGLMKLYGKNVNIDDRTIVSFARDISLVSDDQYQNLNPPSEIKHFPQDLANNDLEYSGIYEDGWISEDSYVKLKQSKLTSQLMVEGMIPKLDSNFTGSTLTILLDGVKLAEQKLSPGDFKVNLLITDGHVGRRKIELHFSKLQYLKQPDGRPTAGLIKFIGFG